MKILGIQSRVFALAIVAGLSAFSASIHAAPAKATVTSVEGAATGASAGDSLGVGAVITTGAGAKVVLDIDGDLVVVTENTALAIGQLDIEETGIEKVSNVQLSLSAGRIYGRVERFSSLSKFVIKIPKGQVTLDASKGWVIFDVSANGQTLIVEGSADIVLNRGTEEAPNIVAQRVQLGQSFNPITNEVTSIPTGERDSLLQMVSDEDAPPPALTTAPPPPVSPFDFFISPNLPKSPPSGGN